MKAHISPKQAKEISEEQFYAFFNEIVPREDWANYHHKKMDIGKMMDYLVDLTVYKSTFGSWKVICFGKHYERDELADALWEAVKDGL